VAGGSHLAEDHAGHVDLLAEPDAARLSTDRPVPLPSFGATRNLSLGGHLERLRGFLAAVDPTTGHVEDKGPPG